MYRIIIIVSSTQMTGVHQKIGEMLMWVQVNVAHIYFALLWFPGMEPEIAQAHFS